MGAEDNPRDLISKELVGLLGESRSQQFKSQVAAFDQRIMDRQADRLVQVSAGTAPQIIHSSAAQLASNRLPDKGDNDTGENPQAAAPAIPMTKIEDVIIIIDGVAYYTNIYTDGRLDPI